MLRNTRAVAAMLMAAVLAVTAACGGAPERSPDPGLTVYQGDGFTVGYPKAWRRDDRHRVFRGADAEVVQPDPAGGRPAASWSVFTEEESRPLERLVDGFIVHSRTARDFQLIERRKLDGPEAYVIRKGYSAAAGQGRRLHLRQVDLFVRVSPGSVIDVRMVFLADRYEPARRQIDAVLDSFRVRT